MGGMQEAPARSVRTFNVQKYNMYDGPGVRSMAFFKGCPLRCKWCSNPESQHRGFEIMLKRDACVSCGACATACPVGVHRMVDGAHVVDRGVSCIGCGACEKACLYGAVQVMGEDRSIDELVAFFDEDADFYRMSGGGITLSGGEALSQPQGAKSLLAASRERGYHTAVETCGYLPTETLLDIAPYVDLFLYDIKLMDPVRHKHWCGVNNELILENVRTLLEQGYNVRVRIPLLRGVNDSEADIKAVIEFFSPYRYQKNFDGVDLLPYHKLGVGKYAQLDLVYEIEDDPSLSDADLDRVAGWIKGADFTVNLVRH